MPEIAPVIRYTRREELRLYAEFGLAVLVGWGGCAALLGWGLLAWLT